MKKEIANQMATKIEIEKRERRINLPVDAPFMFYANELSPSKLLFQQFIKSENNTEKQTKDITDLKFQK